MIKGKIFLRVFEPESTKRPVTVQSVDLTTEPRGIVFFNVNVQLKLR